MKATTFHWVAGLCIAATLPSPSRAGQYVAASSISGSMLASACETHVSDRFDACSAYILGVSDQLALDKRFCLEGETHSSQTVAIVQKYLRDHPEKWNFAPSMIVKAALLPAFACPK